MQTFPIFLALQDRPVLVVGGGEPAARKVELLLAAGARVTLIADAVVGEIAQMIAEARISWAGRAFDDGDLSDMALVIVATHDEALQVRVSDAARRRCLPVNVVDRPALSSFIMPAIVDRAPVTIAISTGGAAPALARRLRAEIERAMPAAVGRLAQSILFGIAPQDPLTLATTAAVLLAAVLVASWLPARRAARIDPVSALRS